MSSAAGAAGGGEGQVPVVGRMPDMPPGLARARGVQYDPDPKGRWPGEGRFNMPGRVYCRTCTKINHKGSGQRRVLVVARTNVYLCNDDGGCNVTRFLKYRQIDELRLRPRPVAKDGPGLWEMLWKLDAPEHDILLRLEGDEQAVLYLAGVVRLAKEAICGLPLRVQVLDAASPELVGGANLVKSKLWTHPRKVLADAQANPDAVNMLAGTDSAQPRAAPGMSAAETRERQAGCAERERSLDEAWYGLNRMEQELDLEEEELHAEPDEADPELDALLAARAAREQRGVRTLTPPGGGPAALPPPSTGAYPCAPSPSPRRRELTDGALPAPAWDPAAVAPPPPRPLRDPYETGPPCAEADTHLWRAGVTYWGSDLHRPLPCRASGPVLIGGAPPPPRHRGATAEELDYWVRFVQRWEAEGRAQAEGL